jgi:hypothetical protein
MASAQAPSASARPIGGAAALARIRWDRLGRTAMLCLLIALTYLYVSAGIRIYSTWRQARSDTAQLATLEREHALLAGQHEALARRGTVEEEARQLDMARPNEQQYILPGLPRN